MNPLNGQLISVRSPRRWLVGVLAGLLLWARWATPLAHGAEVPKEFQLKAVLLWRLAQFVEWPAESFANPQSPIIIGVLGENPFGRSLEIATDRETAHGRPIKIRYFSNFARMSDCHVLYIAQSETPRVREIIARVEHKAVLTVSDIEDFATAEGGMVSFSTSQNKVGLRINLETAKAAGLSIDGRLLRIAEVVPK